MQLNFLIIGKHQEILDTLKRLIENNGWQALVLSEETQLAEVLQHNRVDVILLSAGLPEQTEVDIKAYALSVNSEIRVIQHYGGGSGLLKNEIYAHFPECINP
ncbi:hypothetical protein [Sphingobacterium suaedae]|uniref:Uncharacterized protein n=1 Tax=Sphingobacterium suaedae TaxID=1686402 RepID=A0ABW5KEE6_9SPHI